jgi:predicted ATPase with chaperone activity
VGKYLIILPAQSRGAGLFHGRNGEPFTLSPQDRVLRVSGTVCDLEASNGIKPYHIAEDVSCRSLFGVFPRRI